MLILCNIIFLYYICNTKIKPHLENRETHQIIEIPRQASSSNGGPRLRVAFMPVDYKGNELSNHVYRSFVTPRVRLAFMPVDYKGNELSNHVYRSFVTPRVRLFLYILFNFFPFRCHSFITFK